MRQKFQMNKLFKLIYLILILTLNFSCVEKKSTQTEISNSELVNFSKKDTLQFTSGIRSIFQDINGNYWLGSHGEGACLFDGKSFEYFTTNEGLPDNQIRSLKEDENGNIWFGTAHGVSMYDGEKFTSYPTDINGPKLEWNATTGSLWFNAGSHAGVNRFDGQNLNYLPFPRPKNEYPDNSFGVTDISIGNDGKLWIATYASLFNYDGKTIRIFDKTQLALNEGEELHIRSVFADSKGRIWIGNNGIGVIVLQENSAINFSAQNGLIHKSSNKNGIHSPAGTLEHVFVIEEDSEGIIWFGDRDTGAWKFDGQTMTNYTIDSKLSTQMIWEIYEDNNGNLLFAMAEGGVYLFNGKAFDKWF